MTESDIKQATYPTGSKIERRLFADPGFELTGMIGGANPVTVEFDVDGFPAAFHARGSWWRVYVGIHGGDPFTVKEQLMSIEAFYDDWPAAGRIPLDEAYAFIEQGIAMFRKIRELSGGNFEKTERRLG